MLQKYIAQSGLDLSGDQYLFRTKGSCKSVSKNKPLGYTRTREVMTEKLLSVVGTHSMRSGGDIAAANSEVYSKCLERHGRWKSNKSKR